MDLLKTWKFEFHHIRTASTWARAQNCSSIAPPGGNEIA